MVHYTKEQVIKAFEDMRNAWLVINDSYNDIDDAYGVNDWFNDACGTVDADTGEKIVFLYLACFSGSFDEIPMIEFCRAMEDYLKGLGSSKTESRLKIKVPERKSFEDKGIDWDSIQGIFHKYIIAGDSPNSLPVKSGGYTLAKGSIKGVLKDSSGKSLFGLNYDFSDDTRGDIFVVNIGMSPADFEKVKSIAWDIADECDNGYYSAYVHAYSNEDGYYKDSLNDFGKHDYARACGIFDEDCGSSASSLGAAPTGGRRKMDDESVHRTRHYGR